MSTEYISDTERRLMETKVSRNIMIDPSLLVRKWTSEYLRDHLPTWKKHGYTFYSPRAFWDLVDSVSPLSLSEVPAYRWFLDHGWRAPEPARLIETWNAVRHEVEPFSAKYPPDTPRVLLTPVHDDPIISSIVAEEWDFLMNYSTIISRLRKPFGAMIKGGAVALEFGKSKTERLIRLTVKKPEDALVTRLDCFRTVAKWIAVAGPAVAGVPAASLISGLFLLYDPKPAS